MASLDDILTTQKNGVIAVNSLNQTTINQGGSVTSTTISGAIPTLIVTGAGRLVNMSVIDAGSAVGGVYNALTNDTGSLLISNQLCVIPNTAGIHTAGLIFTDGLVVYPGPSQSVNVTYSIG